MMKPLLLTATLMAIAPLSYSQGQITLICEPACSTTQIAAHTLSDLVMNPALPTGIDWQTAKISTPASDALQQQNQQHIVAKLTALASQLQQQGEYIQMQRINVLRQRIEHLQVVGAYPLSLDPDHVRLKPEYSPPLEGDYRLYVSTRSQPDITLWNSSRTVSTFVAGKQTSAYVEVDQQQPGIDADTVTVIAPDGTTETVPTGYWNRRYHEPQPGSQIWLNLQTSALPEGYQTLNQDIIQLLTQRTVAP
ncbi:capsule biosynthesis GfcC D2 domain-containing protein [Kluyvera sichuanensis]|uniref:capsule biosynthesis GfcC D2 domain-containing protein n=1 Tax=Kluyvera sichuanensis TaxID=2725494 RepID=UPI0034A33221